MMTVMSTDDEPVVSTFATKNRSMTDVLINRLHSEEPQTGGVDRNASTVTRAWEINRSMTAWKDVGNGSIRSRDAWRWTNELATTITFARRVPAKDETIIFDLRIEPC